MSHGFTPVEMLRGSPELGGKPVAAQGAPLRGIRVFRGLAGRHHDGGGDAGRAAPAVHRGA